ncbi:hypothetical protein GCM10018777_21010 [Streptomyces albogriseolus]|nr:hypothetical protein GCM10018777_21010 [Streptomyces viridodiastaticus]
MEPGGEASAAVGVMTTEAAARAAIPARVLRAMWGSFIVEGCGEYRQGLLKLLAESFSNLAATQMLEARNPKGQRAVPT